MYQHVFFLPWVGSDYQTGGIFDKKILVLGESHYCGGCSQCGLQYTPADKVADCECSQMTNWTVNYILSGGVDKWTPTYRKFEKSLVNRDTTIEESNLIWNSLAFMNYLQVSVDDSRQAGSLEDYHNGALAFLEVIEDLKPDLVIVWGVTRMYNYLPSKNWSDGEQWTEEGYNVLNGYYKLSNGHSVRVVNVYHPSVGYSWDWWHNHVIGKLCKSSL